MSVSLPSHPTAVEVACWPVSWLAGRSTSSPSRGGPSGNVKGARRIQSRGRPGLRAPQLGPPFPVPDEARRFARDGHHTDVQVNANGTLRSSAAGLSGRQAEGGERAIEDQRRMVGARARQHLGQFRHGRAQEALPRLPHRLGQHRGGVGGQALRDQPAGEVREGALAHEDDGGHRRIGERRPVQRLGQAAGDVGAGDELQPPRGQPARERDARMRRRGTGRGHARHDLVRDSRGQKRTDLFLEPAEEARVARLQPHHALARLRMLDQKRIHMLLLRRGPAGALAHRDPLRPRPRMVQHRSRGEVVVKHDIGALEPVDRLEGDQLGIARAGGNEGDEAGHALAFAIRWKKVPVTRPPPGVRRVEPVSATAAPVASVTTASGASGWARIVA
ncbi:hypothetical protein SDC9_13010 [bioreactor metagenome]|uniref:Uncharacterized protein n=1 Tax=bioreactor metagenome TaxID=1076179 RepID=A0A644TKV9_9ZZZZ